VMVIGADVMSSILDYTDRATCILFGDGAGAVLLEPCAEGEIGMIDFWHEVDGSGGASLRMLRVDRFCDIGGDGSQSSTLCRAGWTGSVQVRRPQDGERLL